MGHSEESNISVESSKLMQVYNTTLPRAVKDRLLYNIDLKSKLKDCRNTLVNNYISVMANVYDITVELDIIGNTETDELHIPMKNMLLDKLQ